MEYKTKMNETKDYKPLCYPYEGGIKLYEKEFIQPETRKELSKNSIEKILNSILTFQKQM